MLTECSYVDEMLSKFEMSLSEFEWNQKNVALPLLNPRPSGIDNAAGICTHPIWTLLTNNGGSRGRALLSQMDRSSRSACLQKWRWPEASRRSARTSKILNLTCGAAGRLVPKNPIGICTSVQIPDDDRPRHAHCIIVCASHCQWQIAVNPQKMSMIWCKMM